MAYVCARRTFESCRYHAHAIVAIQVLDTLADQAHEKSSMEAIWGWRVDLDEVGKLCLALRWRFGVENVDDEISVLDADHVVVSFVVAFKSE
jgi:hypothetical protein